MKQQQYMDMVSEYLSKNLGGVVEVKELPFSFNMRKLSRWERFKVAVGLSPEHFPVRIDWIYGGWHFNTIYTGPAEGDCMEPMAAQLYRAYLKRSNENEQETLYPANQKPV